MDKQENINIQIQYKMVEKLTEINRKLQHEITVRKISEKDLGESEKRYRELIENATGIIYQLDLKGCFTYINNVGLQLIKAKEEDVIGQHFSILVHKDYKKKTIEFYSNILKSKATEPYLEFPLNISESEAQIWLSTSVKTIIKKGHMIGYQAFSRDITESKKHQRELIKSKEKAEEALKVRSQFLANMSHEIRTPINGIMGLTKLLQKTSLAGKQAEYLNAIDTSSNMLLLIINDILDISKIEAGKMIIEQHDFKLHDLIYSIIDVFEIRAKEKKIDLKCNLDDDLPKIIIGDPLRLNQILYNLLGNAIKFTSKGVVTLTVKVNPDNTNDFESSLLFQVSDTGIGIPKEKHQQIFSEFTQANGNTTRVFGGTGLGLSIVKSLTTLQGGTLGVESEEDKGATFWVALVYENGSIKNLQDQPLSKNNFDIDGIRILLVEDNPVNQLVACDLLNEEGANVRIVENGKLALEAYRNDDFDIILMDMQMPVMDGYEAIKLIRSDFPNSKKSIPIIALTAHAVEGEQEKCLYAGANDYITKPFQPNELFGKIFLLTDISNKPFKNNTIMVNIDTLRRFTNNKTSLMQNTIKTIIKIIPEELKLLNEAVINENWDRIRALAHKNKSSLALVCEPFIKDLLSSIEDDAINMNNMEGITKHVNWLNNNVNELISELEKISNKLTQTKGK